MIGDGWPLRWEVAHDDGHYDVQGHLNNVAALEIFQELRVRYMGGLVGRREMGLVARDHVVGVRELVTSYITEARPGEPLVGHCRILGRSRRSWAFDEVITTGERVVARCRVVECAIGDGRAIEVPEPFWARVQQVEGRELPVRELPVGRTPWEQS
jgi:acyl-CoA thioesterase FadM